MIEVDVEIQRGRFELKTRFKSASPTLALFGPSGSGKSTLLALLAGLIRPKRGRIVINDKVLLDTETGVYVPVHRRHIGWVFQDALLFPHLSVRANLLYGARVRRAVDAGDQPSLNEVVGLLGISRLLDQWPATLSGGESQRVAIGRALLSSPQLLLLDEPLSALDFSRRQEIMPYLTALRSRVDVPLVYVSHALEEVVRLVDDVVQLDNGQVVGQCPPRDLIVSAGDHEGFSTVSVLEATIAAYDEYYGLTELHHPAGRLSLPGRLGRAGATHRVLVRSTDVAIAVSRPRDISHRTCLQARVSALSGEKTPLVRVELSLFGHGRLAALITRRAVDDLGLGVGDQVFALAKATAMDDRAFALAPVRSPHDVLNTAGSRSN